MSLAFLSPDATADLVALIDERIVYRLGEYQPMGSESPWLTVAEAAEYLRTTPDAIYKRINRGQLRAHRPEGSRIMLYRPELDATLDLRDARSYDVTHTANWPREAATSGAAAPGGMS